MSRRPRRGTQARRILDTLEERGTIGLSAREAIYDMGITRLAAIVHELKKPKYGYRIRTETDRGETARYYLDRHHTPPATLPAPPVSECSICLMSIPYHTPSCPLYERDAVADALEGAE